MNKPPRVENRPYKLCIPTRSGGKKFIILSVPMTWDDEEKEWLMTDEAIATVENEQGRRMGFLIPPDLKAIRAKLKLTQKQMARLIDVGEKTWTRWESGKHRPTESSALIIRALIEEKISLDWLKERSGLVKSVQAKAKADTVRAAIGNIVFRAFPIIVRDRDFSDYASSGGWGYLNVENELACAQ